MNVQAVVGSMTSAAFVLICVAGLTAAVAADSPSFMLVSGISSSEEMCVVVDSGNVDSEGADVVLESCAMAIAAGDGRDLWQRLPDGQISNVAGGRCVGTSGDTVVLMACDGGSTWETTASGQLKLGRDKGQYCLSQQGLAGGMEDVAARGAISASSTADTVAHGANMAVDGSSNTFWASTLDPDSDVTITVDFGAAVKLSAAELQWEFPAKAFSVSVSTDGAKWSEVYATDSNVLSSTSVALGSTLASQLRIVMHEAAGTFQGHSVYGIRGLTLLAHRLKTIIADCTTAAKINDARDKYFETHVAEFVPCSSKALRSELPSLEVARASVASVAAELKGILPKLGSCHGAALVKVLGVLWASGASYSPSHLSSEARAQLVQNVDSQNGINSNAAIALMRQARSIIVAARGALF